MNIGQLSVSAPVTVRCSSLDLLSFLARSSSLSRCPKLTEALEA
jgi:hypothetical protein